MLVIELKLCVVIATVDDVRNRRRTRDVEDEKTNPAPARGELPPGVRSSQGILPRNPLFLKVERTS
jgi:hypothetical protein